MINVYEGDKTFVVETPAGSSNFSRNSGELETIKTPLYPFRYYDKVKKTIEWYDFSKTARTEAFGYLYPETVGLSYMVSSAARIGMRKNIAELYAPIPGAIWQSKKHIKTAGQDLLPQANISKTVVEKELPATAAQQITLSEQLPPAKELLEVSLKPEKPMLRELAPDNTYLEWITNISAEKHTLDGD